MKKIVFVFTFILIGLSVKSQLINLEFNAGYGCYNLKDVKAFQNRLSDIGPLPNIKSVERFPSSAYYSTSLNLSLGSSSQLGVEFSYLTSGGRNHVADYSGEYKLDMLLNGYKIGAKYQYLIYDRNRLSFGIQIAGGWIMSNLDLTEYMVVQDVMLIDNKMNLKGKGMYIESGLRFLYEFSNRMNIHFDMQYEYDLENKLKQKGQNVSVQANWSGIRPSIGISYQIF
ncbi:hypothetical protein [Labilibaculum euxinus]|uniref:Outer membrane beta-barrel protein n=1 Tax=Labilibaculum euxinus TaxID=2686357 RepID=A0A7M4D7W1_9BACT|nr:hypothetical protein [Labilibaculum euxinus]MUP38740.1 hypothetical protein [Labilibaculum euxinus]MVB07945.1 hypothetical protein [Labilibaculum euxinus]